MKAMTNTVFKEPGLQMQAVTQMLYVFSCKQSKITSTLILQSFSIELPHKNSLAEMLDNAFIEVKQ